MLSAHNEVDLRAWIRLSRLHARASRAMSESSGLAVLEECIPTNIPSFAQERWTN
jgi:hypothetical protein